MMAKHQYDVLLLGDYFFDIIYTGLPEFPTLGREIYSTSMTSTGGAMFITAAALRRLGVNVAWAGQFGNDEYSQFVLDLARQEGIDASVARMLNQPYRRVTTSMPIQSERAFVTYSDESPEDWFDYWLESAEKVDYQHLHLGGLLCIEKAEPLFEIARRRGATVSMDCQDVPLLTEGCDWKKLLGMVDIFMPNAREARMVAKMDDVQAAIRLIRQLTACLVVKDGGDGAWVADAESIKHVAHIDAGEVIDTTGAGDCFNAGFLYGYVVKGLAQDMAAVYGNICGGLSVTGVGGATTAPNLAELEHWLSVAY